MTYTYSPDPAEERRLQNANTDARAEIDQTAAGIVLAGDEPTVEAIAQEMEQRHTTVLPADLPDADMLNWCTQRGLRIMIREQLGLPEEE